MRYGEGVVFPSGKGPHQRTGYDNAKQDIFDAEEAFSIDKKSVDIYFYAVAQRGACSEEEEKRVLGSATRFDRDNTWGIFNCEGDNETYYEKMHSYSTNLALQFGNHFNTANAELMTEGFFSDIEFSK